MTVSEQWQLNSIFPLVHWVITGNTQNLPCQLLPWQMLIGGEVVGFPLLFVKKALCSWWLHSRVLETLESWLLWHAGLTIFYVNVIIKDKFDPRVIQLPCFLQFFWGIAVTRKWQYQNRNSRHLHSKTLTCLLSGVTK